MEIHSTVLLSFFFLPLSLILYYHYKFSSNRNSTRHSLNPYPLLGILPQFIKNQNRFLEWTTEILTQIPTHTMSLQLPGGFAGVITANPENLEHVLKTNSENYPRGENTREMLREFLGHGISNSDGEEWRWQRKAVSYEFNKRSFKDFVLEAVELEIVDRLLPLFNKFQNTDKTLDLQDVLERFGVDTICKAAFNEDPRCLSEESMKEDTESSELMRAFDEAQAITMDRIRSPFKILWKIKKLLNVGSEKRLRESVATIHKCATKIIHSRKEKTNLDGYHDLLSSLVSNKQISEELLRDNVTNFILGGRGTTSSALTWFFWTISTRPDIKEKIVEETKRVRKRNNTSSIFSFDCLHEMHYIHAAITESMRLYPPVSFGTTDCLKDDELPDGTKIFKGWFMGYNYYAMGRMEDIWGEDCEEYKPERWLENGEFKAPSPFVYPIFHAGPRLCIGREMAYIQMKLIIACVVENFDFVVLGGGVPEPVLSITVKMKGGLPVRVIKKVI